MATESVATRIETASSSIDGAAAAIFDLVTSDDARVARIAHAIGDLLERISGDLDQIAVEVAQLTQAGE